MQKENELPIDTLEELTEELPDNSARYVVLSYPIKLDDGRIKNPLVLLYWRPPTCGQESKMLYAGAVELIREKAGVSQYVSFSFSFFSFHSILTTSDLSKSKTRRISKVWRNNYISIHGWGDPSMKLGLALSLYTTRNEHCYKI